MRARTQLHNIFRFLSTVRFRWIHRFIQDQCSVLWQVPLYKCRPVVDPGVSWQLTQLSGQLGGVTPPVATVVLDMLSLSTGYLIPNRFVNGLPIAKEHASLGEIVLGRSWASVCKGCHVE